MVTIKGNKRSISLVFTYFSKIECHWIGAWYFLSSYKKPAVLIPHFRIPGVKAIDALKLFSRNQSAQMMH